MDSLYGYGGQFGYVYDQETKQYFLQSRYYDPEIGRFTTKDRFKGFEDRPASQNQYTYCESDPVNNVDPLGAFSISWATQRNVIGTILNIAFMLLVGGGASLTGKLVAKYAQKIGAAKVELAVKRATLEGLREVLGRAAIVDRIMSNFSKFYGLMLTAAISPGKLPFDWTDGFDGKKNGRWDWLG